MERKNTDSLYLPAALALAALFAFLALYKLGSVPAAIDEAWITRDTVLAMNREPSLLLRPFLFWPKLLLPNMTCFYTGVLPNLIELPFLLSLGLSYFSMRIGFVLLSAAGLLALASCLGRWLGKWPALLAVFLALTDTMYIRALRRGPEHEELIVLNLFWIGLALLVPAKNRNRVLRAACAGFVWGVAVWGKLHACVYIAGAAAAWLLFFRAPKALPGNAREKLAFALAFAAGLLPLINVYLSLLGPFVSGDLSCGAGPGTGLAESFRARCGHFTALLQEKPFGEWMAAPHIDFPLFAFAAIGLLLVCALRPQALGLREKSARMAKSLLLIYVPAFAAIMFAPQTNNIAHISVLLLLVPIGAAIVAGAATGAGRKTRTALFLVLALTFAHSFAGRFLIMKTYFKQLDQSADYRRWAMDTTGAMYARAGNGPVLTESFACAHMLAARWMGRRLPVNREISGAFDDVEKFPRSFFLITNRPIHSPPAHIRLVQEKSYDSAYKRDDFFLYSIDGAFEASLMEHQFFHPGPDWFETESGHAK